MTDNIMSVYSNFHAAFHEECDDLDVALYVFRTDLIFKEFPCFVIGPIGYPRHSRYMADSIHFGRQGERIEFSVGLGIKTKDDYIFDEKSGVQLLMYLIEELRKMLRRIRRRRDFCENISYDINSPILYDVDSQTFEYNLHIILTVLGGGVGDD